ncbi:VWA domain-containing protein [Aldersonia sp. NBC_00410]|uniref:vWA domain-containing protein n=1 Tax=Aldersonia sp. NBC_00410 TaxID=2975954 RepID=UPI0022501EEC|nr:VWA domain-containing protein [Aldersonia sp. NBC_00410]MCX5042767.1 VWA domain-containing protein [Aldersonia sp. NBC_00410]
MTALAPHGLPGHLVGFVEALRARGIPVGPSETVDAGHVLAALDLLDRDVVRAGLASALLRRPTHRPTFDAMFDLWFPVAIGERSEAAELELPRKDDGAVDIAALRAMLADLLAADDTAQLEALAAQLVEGLGRYESASGPSFSAYQALREVAPDSLLARIIAGLRNGVPDDDFATEVARRTARERVTNFRRTVEAETRRRSAERLGRERVSNYGVPRQADEVDFLRASETELVQLRRSVHALARLLASRLASRRRRARAGEIDLRKTLRKSMSTGGVPIDLVHRKPRPSRPELVILCDVSGSVAGFSQFTLLLVNALREQFAKVRIFAFIDATDEVTDLFDPHTDVSTAMTRMMAEADLVHYDGHSDYGNALSTFAEQWSHVVTARSSLLVLGDARSNYRDPNLDTLRGFVDIAKHAYWLNPEQRNQWGSGDSAADDYEQVIEMRECRNAKQLTAVVAGILPI